MFQGLRVTDFGSGMPSGIATMVMADYGAEVIKVEPPGGDPFRHVPASIQWYRGKKSVVIDLKSERGRADAQRLGVTSDVVINNFRPGVADRLGIGYETLSEQNPSLVYCSITGFGENGPIAGYKAYEGVVHAKAGRMMEYEGQLERGGPIYACVPVASMGASQLALQGILAALFVRERTGKGQLVQTSLLQALGCYEMFNWLIVQLRDRYPEIFTNYHSMGPSYRSLIAPTKDGYWLQFANVGDREFRAFLKAVEMEDVFAGEQAMPTRVVSTGTAAEDLWQLLLLRIQEKTLDEWMEILMADSNISVEPFRSTQQAMEHPQVIHNGDAIEVEHEQYGKVAQLSPLVKFNDAPSEALVSAPTLGQHTSQILGGLERNRERRFGRGSLPRHALEGVTLLELATYWGGPYGASLLADLGARVIKLEPLEGDPLRRNGALKTVQGKESLAVDLKTANGREILYKLVEKTDLLMHNYRPGVPERLGMEYETLKRINPRLIYLSAGGYGSSGPFASRPAYWVTFGAICGGALYQAGPGVPPAPGTPLTLDEVKRISVHLAKANDGNPDATGAIVVGTALLLGLYAREKTGQGQYLETSMLRSNAYANSGDFIRYEGKPPRVLPDTELRGLGALYRLYHCREGWVFLACLVRREWEGLCKALNKEEWLGDHRFVSPTARAEHDTELAACLEELFEGRTAVEWEQYLAGHDIGCVVADAGQHYTFFMNDEQIRANELSVEAEHPVWGKYIRNAPGVHLSLTPGVAGSGNRTGEHTKLILEELGYTTNEINGLQKAGVVTWPEPVAAPS